MTEYREALAELRGFFLDDKRLARQFEEDITAHWIGQVARGDLDHVSDERQKAILELRDKMTRRDDTAEEVLIQTIQTIESVQDELEHLKTFLHKKADLLCD